ncbi:hypothetical protein PoB_002521200 [Plakobranchus ocellatus]|uniref:Uncharacterized protein n=1 Tax=Plakobranchus ocellatus TaxID=259542 RepID=A0AAV3ZVW0_9GAST|nr:hypothetical protein PoB_002521200 [Plakobranchus ocellatus]
MSGDTYVASSFYRTSEQHLSGPDTASFLQSRETTQVHSTRSTPVSVSSGKPPISSSSRFLREVPVSVSPSDPRGSQWGREDLNANLFPSSPLLSSAAQQCLRELRRSVNLLGESPLLHAASSQPNINDLLMMSSASSHHNNHFSFPDLASVFPFAFPPPPDITGLFNNGGLDVFGNRRMSSSLNVPQNNDSGGDCLTTRTQRTVYNIPVHHEKPMPDTAGQTCNQNYHNLSNAFPVNQSDNKSQTKGDYDVPNCHHRHQNHEDNACGKVNENENIQPGAGPRQDRARNPLRVHIHTYIPPQSPSTRPKSSTPNLSCVERRRISVTPTPGSSSSSSSKSGSARESRHTSQSSSSPSDSPHTPLRLRRWPSDSGLVTKRQHQHPCYQSRPHNHNHHQQQQQQWQRPSSSLSTSASNTMSSTASSSASSTLPSSNSSDPDARPHTPPFPSEESSTAKSDVAARIDDQGVAGGQR